jgi:hypothetical protein
MAASWQDPVWAVTRNSADGGAGFMDASFDDR